MIINIKKLIKKMVLGMSCLSRPSTFYCANHALLPMVFVRTTSAKLRELMLLPESSYVTQLNQDIFALLVNRFNPGFFIEIGANDGFELSNTIYLEEQFGWTGLLVEANPKYVDSLKNRKAKSVVAAVVEEEGNYKFRDAGLYGGVESLLDKTHDKMTRDTPTISVWGTTLERILEENRAPNLINFISIDVEGAEVLIVEQMCQLQSHRFVCGCIEYNKRKTDYQRIVSILLESGYRVFWEGQTGHDLFFIEEEFRL